MKPKTIEEETLVNVLYHVCFQSCCRIPLPEDKDQTIRLDSQFIRAYAVGLRLLGKYGRIKITNDAGEAERLVEAEDINSTENMP